MKCPLCGLPNSGGKSGLMAYHPSCAAVRCFMEIDGPHVPMSPPPVDYLEEMKKTHVYDEAKKDWIIVNE